MTRLPALGLAIGAGLLFAPSAHAVVGGTDVPEGQRGYVAHIEINGGFLCTGTLVSPDTVVTAGHCSSLTGAVVASPLPTDPNLINVTLGSVKAGDPAGEKPEVSRVIIPSDYSFTNSFEANDDGSRGSADSNDVALLKLAAPSQQTPVPLAARGEREFWRPGALAQIAGFGVTDPEGENIPEIMQESVVPIVTDEKAKATYGDDFEPVTQIGAGFPEGGRDTCQGDSGGPLIVPATNGALRLIGDTSYGRGCAEKDTPGIYGRLADDKLRDFILANDPDAAAPEPTTTTTTTTAPTAGGSGSTSPTPSGSAAPSGTPQGSSAPAAPTAAKSALGLSFALDASKKSTALRRGLRLRVRCAQRCTTVTTLTVDRATARRLGLRSRTVARSTRTGAAGRRIVTVRFTKAAQRALTRTQRVSLALRVVATAPGERQSRAKRLTLRR